MCLNHKEITASVYSLSIALAVHPLQAQFVRESPTSPTSILFCSPLERSPECHNSSTSASRAARQLDGSLGVKLSKDLRSFRITLWHRKRRVTFTTFPISWFLFAFFLLVSFTAPTSFCRAEGGQRVPTSTVVKLRTPPRAAAAMGKCWKCEAVMESFFFFAWIKMPVS